MLFVQCSSPNVKELKYLKQKYSVEAINFFYETAFFTDQVGKRDAVSKWNEDIYIYMAGYHPHDSINVENVISMIDSLKLPINMYLTPDSSKANIFIYFGNYSYLKKMGIVDTEMFAGCGNINEYNSFIRSAIVGIANDVEIYKRLNTIDSMNLRQAVILEEITQCLGLIGDSWLYPNSNFFQGGSTATSLSVISKDIVRFLYEPSIPTKYSRIQFEKDFGDVLYHINAPKKIADYVSINNIPFHYLEYIREKSFCDNKLLKWPTEIYIRQKGDFSIEDSIFCRKAVNVFNSVSDQFQLTFAKDDAHVFPAIETNYICDSTIKNIVTNGMIKNSIRYIRALTPGFMMFPRRKIYDIKIIDRREKYSQNARDQLVFGILYESLGFFANTPSVDEDISEFDLLGNISLKQDYREILALIYEPVFYSGLTLKEFDEAIDILKTKGYTYCTK